MSTFSRFAAILFGLMMTVLCIVIALETILRKVFSHSLAGVDELSGYAIAIGAPLCFTVAVIEQAHIRINLLHRKMPVRLQALINALAAVTLALLSLFLLTFTLRTFKETQLFSSVAQTPWATPLVYPQALWLLAMAVFALAAVLLGIKALLLLFNRNIDQLNREFSPDSIEEELAAELSDLEDRG